VDGRKKNLARRGSRAALFDRRRGSGGGSAIDLKARGMSFVPISRRTPEKVQKDFLRRSSGKSGAAKMVLHPSLTH